MIATEIQQYVDVIFPVQAAAIPRDHAYSLYSTLSHALPGLHGSEDIGIFPIPGTPAGDNMLHIPNRSLLRFRVPAARLPLLLPLAGKSLNLNGNLLRIGVPHVAALIPAPALSSPMVVIKLAEPGHKDIGGIVSAETFLAAAQRQLAELNMQAQPGLQLNFTGPHAGKPRRRMIEIKSRKIIGYAMLIQGLSAEESIRLQEQGLGGRRLMGCGLFLPERGNSQ